MFHNFSGRTADDVWVQAAGAFAAANGRPGAGVAAAQPSRAGCTEEILHATMSVAEPRQRWVTSRTPPLNPAFAIAEVIWILNGRNDSRLLNYFNRELPRFAGRDDTYHGAYGHRLRRHLGIDQLDRAYHALSRQPDSRQVVLQIWDGRSDLPLADGQPSAADVPCNVLSMLKVRAGALEWTQILRSNDLFRGVPYNFVQFTTLQEVLAGWLGVAVGSYNHLSDSLHVYAVDAGHVTSTSAAVSVPNTDSLALPKEESERAWAELAARADDVTRDDLTADALAEIVDSSTLPAAYRNLLAVVCAEGARRRRSAEAVEGIIARCSNPCLVALFRRWAERWPGVAESRLASTAHATGEAGRK